MPLTYDEIENFLTFIFTGRKYIIIDGKELYFKFPDNFIKQRASLLYEKSFKDAVEQGMLPLKDLEELINKRNLISKEETDKLAKLKSQLEAQEVLLAKTTRVKANQDRIKSVMDRLKLEILQIEYKKRSSLYLSAETKAEEDRAFFTCSRCVYTFDDKLYWENYSDYLNDTDSEFIKAVLTEFKDFYSGLPVKVLREIARSSLWRIRYVNSMKTSDPLFGVPSSEYTNDQLSLVNWSSYYQNIFEMLPEDRPSDLIIEDDVALDAYMKDIYKERSQDNAARKHSSKRRGKLDAFNSEELIITRSNELYQDMEYDAPREAQKIKNRVDLKKRTKKG